MIELHNVSKIYETRGLNRRVLTNLSMRIEPGESLAVCGANGAGKSTLLRLIAGIEHPSSGRVERKMSTSWPIGFTSAFQMGMTGADNARFIARIYQQDERRILDYVDDFAQLGVYMNQTVSTYSSGMVSRLAFGISLAISFDCYLIDEVAAAGDVRFRKRCEEELMARRNNGTLVMTSHDPYMLQQYCKRGAVLYSGALVLFDTVEEACEVHHSLQMRQA
jgi:capsular polysaccharide transport system ATP-binding protein